MYNSLYSLWIATSIRYSHTRNYILYNFLGFNLHTCTCTLAFQHPFWWFFHLIVIIARPPQTLQPYLPIVISNKVNLNTNFTGLVFLLWSKDIILHTRTPKTGPRPTRTPGTAETASTFRSISAGQVILFSYSLHGLQFNWRSIVASVYSSHPAIARV